MTTFRVSVLPEGRYKTDEFLVLLGRTAKCPVSDRTFRDWCRFFGIYRDDDGYFWAEDLALLRGWIRYRSKHGRKRNRKDYLVEYQAKQAGKPQTVTTIDVQGK